MPIQLENALLLMKPNQNQLINRLIMTGFHIIHSKHVYLTKDQAMEFYELNRNDRPFTNLSLLKVNITKNIACKPILVLCVARLNAIVELKAIFADAAKWNKQLFHYTKDSADADSELRFFFSNTVRRDIRGKTTARIRKYLDKYVFPVLIRSLVDVADRKDEENADLLTLIVEIANNDSNRPIVTFPDDDVE